MGLQATFLGGPETDLHCLAGAIVITYFPGWFSVMVQCSAPTAAERRPHSAFPVGAHAMKTDRSAPWIPLRAFPWLLAATHLPSGPWSVSL